MKFVSSLLGALLVLTSVLRAVPGNDDRADAEAMMARVAVMGSLEEATLEEGEETPQSAFASVWYEWTVSESGRWEARVQSGSGRAIPVAYNGELQELGKGAFHRSERDEATESNRYPASLGARFEAEAGEKIFIQVYSRAAFSGDFELRLQSLGGGPLGDDFAEAVPLTGLLMRESIPMTGVTFELGEPASNLAGSVWRSWRAPESGIWLFSVTGLSGAAGVDLWQGESLENLESVVVGSSRADQFDATSAISPNLSLARLEAGERIWVRLLSDGDGSVLFSVREGTVGDLFSEPLDLGSVEELRHVRSLNQPVTYELDEPRAVGPTQWLLWQAPADGVCELRISAPREGGSFGAVRGYRPFVNVYRGEAVGALVAVPKIPVGISDGVLRFEAEAGEVFRIRAGLSGFGGFIGFDSGSGGILGFPTELIMDLKFHDEQPVNDDFGNASEFSEPGMLSGNTVGATMEEAEVVGRFGAGDSVWHRWAVPETRSYELLFTSEENLELGLFRGTEIDALTRVSGGEVLPGQGQHALVRMRVSVVENEVYYLRIVGGGYGAQGEYTVEVRAITPPMNDDLADAISLGEMVPATGRGTTVFGSVEMPLERSVDEENSSIWWKWTAPESGFFEVTADGSLGLLEDGARYGSLTEAGGNLRFLAVAGREYHVRVAHDWSAEREVSLALDRIGDLAHLNAETAIPVGSAMRFSTPKTETQRGRVLTMDGENQVVVWHEWVPESSGWVNVKTEGSDEVPALKIFRAGDLRRSLVSGGIAGFSRLQKSRDFSSSYNFRRVNERGFLRNEILQDARFRFRNPGSLVEVEAGERYFIVLAPAGGTRTTGVMAQVQPASERPEIASDGVRWKLSEDGGFLEAMVEVVSPNGFRVGRISNSSGSAGFSDRDRVAGDAYRGTYRVVFPRLVSEQDIEVRGTVTVMDRMGGSFAMSAEPVVLAGSTASADVVGPLFEGLAGGSLKVTLVGEAAEVILELAISDEGGSGFEKGEILLPGWGRDQASFRSLNFFNGVSPAPLEDLLDYGGERLGVVEFGAAERVRGDDQVGIYEVRFMVPAETPAGPLKLRLRDAAGNLGGSPVTSQGGDVRVTRFKPGQILPVMILREDFDPLNREAAELGEVDAVLADGVVRARAVLEHARGVSGGQVILTDESGVIVGARAFDAEALVDGRYLVEVPVPEVGFGGAHAVAWEVLSADGVVAIFAQTAIVELENRSFVDGRGPELTRFQVSPSEVDLQAGASEISVSLAANDDRAGVVAEVRVFDGESRLIAEEVIDCEEAVLDCVTTISLPQIVSAGRSTGARFEVTLRDRAGRAAHYGRGEDREWSGGLVPQLSLFPEMPERLDFWRERWSLDREMDDSDGDGWSDLLEFSLGTDPTMAAVNDPLAGRLPVVEIIDNVWGVNGPERLQQMFFRLAPWLVDTERSPWRISVEESVDLKTWEALDEPFEFVISADRASATSARPMQQRTSWLRLRVRRE